MEFKDYYTTLGLNATASADEIKLAYRKLARKYHPDVSQEPDAEARFKEVAEAYEVLHDAERRAAYDAIAVRHRRGQDYNPPPGWDGGFGFGAGSADPEHSDFYDSLFGRPGRGGRGRRAASKAGEDLHAKVRIDLLSAYLGGPRSLTLRTPKLTAQGRTKIRERQIEIQIPKGVCQGQKLRLVGQGGGGRGEGMAGDLYLEIEIAPHPQFRLIGRDVEFDLPLAPWEAALGAQISVPVPDGSHIELTIPPGSVAGRKLRVKGKGIPGLPAGDLYLCLSVALPPADGEALRQAYLDLARASVGFDPRPPAP